VDARIAPYLGYPVFKLPTLPTFYKGEPIHIHAFNQPICDNNQKGLQFLLSQNYHEYTNNIESIIHKRLARASHITTIAYVYRHVYVPGRTPKGLFPTHCHLKQYALYCTIQHNGKNCLLIHPHSTITFCLLRNGDSREKEREAAAASNIVSTPLPSVTLEHKL
jgi:hypothetical protein